MYPDGVWRPWGVDPRITTAEIARHVGLSRKSVWARIQQWKREGFWNGFVVSPNLSIFAVETLRAEIHVSDSAEGSALLEELELVDGVLYGEVTFGDSASARDVETVLVGMVGDGAASVARRMKTLRRLARGRKLNGPYRDTPPDCSIALALLDWRIVAAIVASPNSTITQVARQVGVTPKSVARRQSNLIRGRALFYFPRVDWAKLPAVELTVFCQQGSEAKQVRTELENRFPHCLPMTAEGLGYLGPEYSASPWLGVRVPVRSPAEVQMLVLSLSKLPGVRLVRPQFRGPSRAFPRWVDQQLAKRLAGRTATRLPHVRIRKAPVG